MAQLKRPSKKELLRVTRTYRNMLDSIISKLQFDMYYKVKDVAGDIKAIGDACNKTLNTFDKYHDEGPDTYS